MSWMLKNYSPFRKSVIRNHLCNKAARRWRSWRNYWQVSIQSLVADGFQPLQSRWRLPRATCFNPVPRSRGISAIGSPLATTTFSVSIQSLVAEGFQHTHMYCRNLQCSVSIQSLVAEGFQRGCFGLPPLKNWFQSSPS